MDEFYDLESAGIALEQSSVEQNGYKDRRLAQYQVDQIAKIVRVVKFAGPHSWRLVNANNSGNVVDEKVFAIHGIIKEKTLPPVQQEVKRNRLPYLRHGITLVGLGSQTFNKVADLIVEIYGIFDRHAGVGSLNPVELIENNETVIRASNRLFTPRKDAPKMRSIPFARGVDPRSVLTAIVGEAEYIHGEENAVSYYKSVADTKGVKRFEAAEPYIFRVGDIVEVQVSFVVTPSKGGSHRMRTILRSIALINGNFTQKAFRKRITVGGLRTRSALAPDSVILKRQVGYDEAKDNEPATQFILKRKVGYSDDDDSGDDRSGKAPRLSIDEGPEGEQTGEENIQAENRMIIDA